MHPYPRAAAVASRGSLRRLAFAMLAALLLVCALGARDASAAGTASISGSVTDAAGKAITTKDICVSAQRTDGPYAFVNATSTASGGYTLSGLDAGSYRVRFYDCYQSTRNDVPQYYNATAGGTTDYNAATLITLSDGQAKTGVDAKMMPATSISGHVYGTSDTSKPLTDICVYAYPGSASSNAYMTSAYTRTDANGAYKLSQLEPTTSGYKVQFYDCASQRTYLTTWYDGKSDITSADVVKPTAASPSTGIDAHLIKGATISGKVSDAAGKAITTETVCVSAQQTDGGSGSSSYNSTRIKPDGTYTLAALAAGSYKVRFDDCDNGSASRNDVFQYYAGTTDSSAATLVVLSTGGAKTGIDAKMVDGTSIAGHVYAGSGTTAPLASVCITAYAASSDGQSIGTYAANASTDSQGAFVIKHLEPTANGYKLLFADCSSAHVYLSQYLGGKSDAASSTTLKPTVAAPATGADAHMVKGGAISGSVTDAQAKLIKTQDICVTASRVDTQSSGLNSYGYTRTDANGAYNLGALDGGSYRVHFSDCYMGPATRNDVGEYYKDTTDYSAATSVAVTLGATTTGIDAQLAAGTSIRGHVYVGSGTTTPASQVCVYAIPFSATSQYNAVVSGQTGYDGSYWLGTLPSGDYKVRFADCSYGSRKLADQFYDAKADFASATKVTTSLQTPATGIDAHMTTGGPRTTITGGPADGASSNATSSKFSFTSDKSGATFECRLDTATWSACTSPFATGTLANGKHTFSVRSIAGGATDPLPPVVTWTVDTSSPNSTSSGSASAGGSVSSEPGTAPSPSKPVVADVTVPSDGRVTLTTEPSTTQSTNGYQVFGKQIDIAATTSSGGTMTASPSNPIKLSFSIDGSAIPTGTDLSKVTVLRNGSPAADCTGPAGSAIPDPCVSARAPIAGGGLKITVLTTHCSIWNLAVVAKPVTGGGSSSGGSGSTTATPPADTSGSGQSAGGGDPAAAPAPAPAPPAPVSVPSVSPKAGTPAPPAAKKKAKHKKKKAKHKKKRSKRKKKRSKKRHS